MDTVFIQELKVDTVIGIFDWERKCLQTVCIDIEMAKDIKKAAASDSIEYALDYNAVSKRIIQWVENSQCQLIETLAEQVAEIILKEFSVPWIKLKLSKPGAVRDAVAVGVIIERGEMK